MKRKHCFAWFLAALFAVFLTAVAGWQGQDAVAGQNCQEPSGSAVVSTQRQQHCEATLTDTTQLYRICSSRPQRILPTQGSRSGRTLTPLFSRVRHYIVKPLHSFFDSRCRLESAPFCLSASCDYYVIALRHILR